MPLVWALAFDAGDIVERQAVAVDEADMDGAVLVTWAPVATVDRAKLRLWLGPALDGYVELFTEPGLENHWAMLGSCFERPLSWDPVGQDSPQGTARQVIAARTRR